MRFAGSAVTLRPGEGGREVSEKEPIRGAPPAGTSALPASRSRRSAPASPQKSESRRAAEAAQAAQIPVDVAAQQPVHAPLGPRRRPPPAQVAAPAPAGRRRPHRRRRRRAGASGPGAPSAEQVPRSRLLDRLPRDDRRDCLVLLSIDTAVPVGHDQDRVPSRARRVSASRLRRGDPATEGCHAKDRVLTMMSRGSSGCRGAGTRTGRFMRAVAKDVLTLIGYRLAGRRRARHRPACCSTRRPKRPPERLPRSGGTAVPQPGGSYSDPLRNAAHLGSRP